MRSMALVAGRLLSALKRLLTLFLQTMASRGVDDLR